MVVISSFRWKGSDSVREVNIVQRPMQDQTVKSDFFNLLKTEIIINYEYKKVKDLWIILHLENIFELSKYTISKRNNIM